VNLLPHLRRRVLNFDRELCMDLQADAVLIHGMFPDYPTPE